MQTDDQAPEGASADTEAAVETSDNHGDPLDEIQDIEELRGRAKALAAENVKKDKILERNRKPKDPQAPAAPSQPVTVASKEDLAVIVTNQAKELALPEVREHWDELSKIPLEGFNPMNARSIADNMADRLVIFKAKQASKDNPTKELTSSPGIRGSSGEAPKADTTSKFKTKAKDADTWFA